MAPMQLLPSYATLSIRTCELQQHLTNRTPHKNALIPTLRSQLSKKLRQQTPLPPLPSTTEKVKTKPRMTRKTKKRKISSRKQKRTKQLRRLLRRLHTINRKPPNTHNTTMRISDTPVTEYSWSLEFSTPALSSTTLHPITNHHRIVATPPDSSSSSHPAKKNFKKQQTKTKQNKKTKKTSKTN